MDLSNWNNQKMVYKRYIFFNCPKIKFIDVSSFRDYEIYKNILSDISNNATLKVHKDCFEKVKALAFDKNVIISLR